MHSLSIFGTSSDAGKSTLSFALTYLLHKRGIKVAPFKAQNVSNNSMVTDIDSGEIAVPQAFAAEAIGLKSTPLFNPVLLKSGGRGKAHLIINGKTQAVKGVKEYYSRIDALKPVVKEAFSKLQEEYECIVAEGAGSPVELNLMEQDLSNIFIAKEFGTKIILVADIERGGVFASIYGVYNLLPKELQKNVIGVIVNKFRGDMRLFDEGVQIIERDFGLKVLGVVPYRAFNLGFEDSASLQNYTQDTSKAKIKVGVFNLPHMSNFTDFEPLVADKEVELVFIDSKTEAKKMDMLVIPGSKLVFEDMRWLQERGVWEYLKQTKKPLLGICGGYEMLFERLVDPAGVESQTKEMEGLGRFKGEVSFQSQKIVQKGCYNLFGIMTNGYEIHNATVKKRAKQKKNVYGTFVHGLFESDEMRRFFFSQIDSSYEGYDFHTYKHETIERFASFVERHVDVGCIIEKINSV